MDKILAKLKEANISEEDLNTIKESFEAAVQARVDEQSKVISEKADEWCRQKVDAAIKLKTAQLETLAEQYCVKKAATIARKADKKIAEHTARIEKLAQQFIAENFDERFTEKYGQELKLLEDKLVDTVDSYISYAIVEKISPELITKTAVNETLAPIVKGIQNLFEEQYVPLNVSGTKKLKEANRRVAELEAKLKEQINENIRVSESAQAAAKKALIAEKTAKMTDEQKEKVTTFFESKDYSSVAKDIDAYCEVITEHQVNDLPISTAAILHESRQQTLRKTPSIEDGTPDYVTEKFKPIENDAAADEFLLRASQYLND